MSWDAVLCCKHINLQNCDDFKHCDNFVSRDICLLFYLISLSGETKLLYTFLCYSVL